MSFETSAVAAAKKKPCAKTLSQCPLRGCTEEDTPEALCNVLKHGEPKGDLHALTFADFQNLQKQADDDFKTTGYAALSEPKRVRLQHLKLQGQTIGEGSFVEIEGYIAEQPDKPKPSKPHANTGESVNCNLAKAANNDFHINLTPTKGGSEYDGIVVEMVPQDRAESWTEARLKAVQGAHLRVRARGHLFFDNHHKVNSDESHPIKNQPKRISLWEVHPVTEFEVCTKTKCTSDADWTALERWD
ncbi:MAG TPA: hypothetical protein VFV19_18845 [Candidatus Polarisedimenticolaceae bacterium]|nr:hypothetical protein [Candidatus Polarisedimenticolaceae bacterium]